jgi:hypothetical protein
MVAPRLDYYPIVCDRTTGGTLPPRGEAVRATRTLVRLHVAQGYLATARRMLDELSCRSGPAELAAMEALWARAADKARRDAAVGLLNELLARVRKARRRGGRGRAGTPGSEPVRGEPERIRSGFQERGAGRSRA